MIVNTVSSNELFQKNVWSVQFFLPQEEVRTNSEFKLVKLEDLVSERRESVTLTAEDEDVNYIGLENMEAKTGRIAFFLPKHGEEIKSTCKRFYMGDILYGRLRPALNKVYYNDCFEEGVCTTEILVLSPILEKINPVYLAALLRTEAMNRRIVGLTKGAALPRIAMADLKQIALPIPSLQKQNEIADEILRKQRALEEHIRLAHEIPMDIDKYLTAIYK